MASAQVCPVVGTTNSILPPSHPTVDLDKPGQKCPVTNATTDHHHTLAQHPKVPIPEGTSAGDASACPALEKVVSQEQSKAMDDKICPVVGPVTTVLPPDHPNIEDAKNDTCPVTKATLLHHKGKVVKHPSVESAPKGAVCPVVGTKA